jgi:flagellar biosynthesis/type III secretory pathway protein FliH
VSDAFVSLAQWLRPEPESSACAEAELEPVAVNDEPATGLEDLFAEIRRFRAAFADACERESLAVVRDAALTVLGRELRLQPADIGAIVRRICDTRRDCEPLRVRVARCDVAACSVDLPVVADETLRSGDAVIEVRSGTIDARLGVRLETLLGGLEPSAPW